MSIFENIVIAVHSLLTFLNITVTVFLFCESTKSKSTFRSSYFVILNVGYTLVILFSICWIYGHLFDYNFGTVIKSVIVFIQWHSQNILGLWEAMLGLNRCTALAFPFAHKKIWNKTVTGIFILFIILFPFIIDFPTFLNVICNFCNLKESEYLLNSLNTTVANISLSIISILLILFGIFKSPKTQTSTTSLERRLIFQTLLSSISLAALYSVIFLVIFGKISVEQYSFFGNILFLIQFYPSIFILFFVSSVFRKNFIAFYKLNFIFKKTNF